jgi:hypothetical protein
MTEVSKHLPLPEAAGTNLSAGSSVLDRCLASASAQRRTIFEDLSRRPWFRRTAITLQVELANLPAGPTGNFDGFLRDLAARPDRISNVDVISLAGIARGNFAIVPIFNVQNARGIPLPMSM